MARIHPYSPSSTRSYTTANHIWGGCCPLQLPLALTLTAYSSEVSHSGKLLIDLCDVTVGCVITYPRSAFFMAVAAFGCGEAIYNCPANIVQMSYRVRDNSPSLKRTCSAWSSSPWQATLILVGTGIISGVIDIGVEPICSNVSFRVSFFRLSPCRYIWWLKDEHECVLLLVVMLLILWARWFIHYWEALCPVEYYRYLPSSCEGQNRLWQDLTETGQPQTYLAGARQQVKPCRLDYTVYLRHCGVIAVTLRVDNEEYQELDCLYGDFTSNCVYVVVGEVHTNATQTEYPVFGS